MDEPNDGPLVRRARCQGCAFTPGTPAYNQPTTYIKSRLCVESGSYFFCHEDAAGNYTEEPEALCAGWLQAVEAKLDGREYDGMSPRLQAGMVEALDFITEFEQSIDLREVAAAPPSHGEKG